MIPSSMFPPEDRRFTLVLDVGPLGETETQKGGSSRRELSAATSVTGSPVERRLRCGCGSGTLVASGATRAAVLLFVRSGGGSERKRATKGWRRDAVTRHGKQKKLVRTDAVSVAGVGVCMWCQGGGPRNEGSGLSRRER